MLVEKPIAATLAEADALVALAASRGRVLQVGHQEWFNAAMRALPSRSIGRASPRSTGSGRSPSAAPTSTSCAT